MLTQPPVPALRGEDEHLVVMDAARALLGEKPNSSRLLSYLQSVLGSHKPPEIKPYSDAVYFNYFDLGMSLMFIPVDGYKPTSGKDLENDKLKLDSIDLYNAPSQADKQGAKPAGKKLANSKYTSYPLLPITLQDPPAQPSPTSEVRTTLPFEITATSSGKDFVSFFGEPTRKGGGTGPSSGSIGIWCEWKREGLMVEFGGDESRGPQAWERGKDAIWTVITLFAGDGGST